ncbi:hypothetical protein [Hymenobacter sp. AT01-02]|uniref:hypothetical protein n=1 Tax=Hymenobacter sp. AT01-02 TaxID=1571877 RepID=UPI0005F1C3F9|nr:hypothetical protein [Hymenobacter sp. AT01-02]
MPLSSGLLVYFENTIGRLLEHPDGYAVIRYHAGKRTATDFQSFLLHLGRLLRRRNWYKMLADHRASAPFTEEERQWLSSHWLAVSQANQQEMVAALLLPEDVFARLSMNLIMHDAREGALIYHIFNDETEATTWLRQNQ